MSIKTLQATDLPAFLSAIQASHRLIAPVRDGDLVTLGPVTDPADIVPAADYINPRLSFKEFLFPKSEPILRYGRGGDAFDLTDASTTFPPTVVFGCRPCDAASLPIMDALYNWDYKDEFWNARRETTTVVAIACTRADESCFCTALGGSPSGTAGADILLVPTAPDAYLAEVLTDRGQALIALAPSAFGDHTGGDLTDDKQAASQPALDLLPPALDLDGISQWLADHFEDERWAAYSHKCLGCGCCTYLCPTCHCFDIVDEGGYKHGQRRKNWDACQFPLCTLHASGHNPRPDQAARWRQRLEHKFNY
ncbi:MAG: 4Fe-4S dicluster domain-containing protein, partial [Candidatus Brocadiae bacterium]|nr:4Fe-4S dicluster domain-containing protein [Candidatus Brocadiia bacterium]